MRMIKITGIIWLIGILCSITVVAQQQLPDTLCQGSVVREYFVSGWANSTYTWIVEGGQVQPPGNTAQVQVDWTGVPPGVYSITVVEHASDGCDGDPLTGHVFILPAPQVDLPVCFDTLTLTSGLPIRLRGGIPMGGAYAGPGIVNDVFNPGAAGPGVHTITYTVTYSGGCISSASKTIHTYSPPNFTCGQPFTDIRDGTSYNTVLIGTQCWFATNLNYGTMVVANQHLRDNCISEKYCWQDNGQNCSFGGGLYQWDEMMRYEGQQGMQDLCPSGWHVPSHNEWSVLLNYFSVDTNNASAGNYLTLGGNSGFNAELNGIRHMTSMWNWERAFPYNFDTTCCPPQFNVPHPTLNATLFWTSSANSNRKAWAHGMNNFDPSVSTYPGLRSNAFYVRCIKTQ